MSFIKDLYHDEIRDGWLVKSDMKKVWQRQLEIWQEVDRICRKHKITYWADYGTLLGAARHKGFIPWDGDFDLCMIRPDFNRFREVIREELTESRGLFEIKLDNPLFFQISHSQTTLITSDFPNIDQRLPGIAIDIFPLDVGSDDTAGSFLSFNVLYELLITIFNYPVIEKHIKEGGQTVNDWAVIEKIHSLSNTGEQFDFFYLYAGALFNQSSRMGWFDDLLKNTYGCSVPKEWYRETYLSAVRVGEIACPP